MCAKKLMLALTLMASTAAIASDVYRWVDDEGEVHYSDKPEFAQQGELVEVQSQPTDPQRIAAQRAAAAELNDARQTRYSQEDEMAEEDQRVAREVADERAENCEKARERNRVVQDSHRLYKPLENGERQYLTDDELDAARVEAARAVDEWCN